MRANAIGPSGGIETIYPVNKPAISVISIKKSYKFLQFTYSYQ
jgi:hypothetical protein